MMSKPIDLGSFLNEDLGKPTMWTLDEALTLVRRLQPLVRNLDFHFALGGGVLNKGESTNDLDLYLLPVFKGRPYNWGKIQNVLENEFGGASDLIATSQGPTGREGPTYKYQWRFVNGGKIVDVFVGDPEE